MHFYRSPNLTKALTFDLDDTIYDNSPFMQKAEAMFIQTLNQVDGLQSLTEDEYQQFKRDTLAQNPEIYHDVLTFRVEAIKTLLHAKGITDKLQISQITDNAMEIFVLWRNKITIPSESFEILDKLAAKYPLGVISNGNADIDLIGLSPYFQFSLRGGEHGRAKPYDDLFKLASQKLNISCSNILHVGDNLDADVVGALNSGMQACWINIFGQDIYQLAQASQLPHVEIIELSELYYLL